MNLTLIPPELLRIEYDANGNGYSIFINDILTVVQEEKPDNTAWAGTDMVDMAESNATSYYMNTIKPQFIQKLDDYYNNHLLENNYYVDAGGNTWKVSYSEMGQLKAKVDLAVLSKLTNVTLFDSDDTAVVYTIPEAMGLIGTVATMVESVHDTYKIERKKYKDDVTGNIAALFDEYTTNNTANNPFNKDGPV